MPNRNAKLFLIRVAIVVCGCVCGLGAQNPVLAPSADVTITVSTIPLRYSLIQVPVGVTVRFINQWGVPLPFMPAVVECDGDVSIHGKLSVAEEGPILGPAPGVVTTGRPWSSALCGNVWNPFGPAMGGQHAGAYGSAVPFSLEGGSPGANTSVHDVGCWVFQYSEPGGFAGGTLALHAGGRIDIYGTVTANGEFALNGGSGGSILLRGDQGVHIHPGAQVTARGGSGTRPPSPLIVLDPRTFGAPGYIRLDAWGAAPVIQGTVDPAPTTLELPYLRAQSAPQTGSTWLLEVYAPENAPIFLSGSLLPGPGTTTPFGALGIHLPTATGIALTVAQPSHDPYATVPMPVPPAPVLVGLGLWLQAFVVPPALPPRLSNTLAAVVQ